MQNLQAYKNKKKELKLTNKKIADISGIPLRTVEDFFRGAYDNPRIDTVRSIEEALGLSKPPEWTTEEKALGVTDKARIEVNTRQYEWLELGDEVYETKGEQYYKVVCDMIKAAIKQK